MPLMPLGIAHCHQQRFFSIHKYSFNEGRLFELVLSEGQLAALENMRAAGGLVFKFDIYARGEGDRGPEPVQTEFTKEFNLSDWTKMLKDMGAAEYLNVALLLPASDTDDPHAAAIANVRRAQDYFLQGDYRGCVASCREPFEVLTKLHEDVAGKEGPLSSKTVLEAFQTNRSTRTDMSRAQRLVMLRIAANHLTHLGHHPPERSEDVLSRQDAALTISTCAGLISASMSEGLANRHDRSESS